MPTILMSRTERGAASPATPGSRHRSPGRAVSMSRIDMLSVPRQHGKHVTSVSVSPSKAGLSPHVIININSDPHVLLSSCPLLNQYLSDDVRCDLSLQSMSHLAISASHNPARRPASTNTRQRPRPRTLELAKLKDSQGEFFVSNFLTECGGGWCEV